MTSPAEGLADILEADGVIGGASGWLRKIGGLGQAEKEVALLDSGGREGEVKVAIDYPSVQVLVKGSKTDGGYVACYDKSREIYNALTGRDTPDADYPELVSCIAVNPPAWLGRDDKDRPMFSINFRLITEPSTVGNRTY